jgi:hypothetical protein
MFQTGGDIAGYGDGVRMLYGGTTKNQKWVNGGK